MSLSVSEIKKKLDEISINNLEEALTQFENDDRKGVQNLIKKYNKKIDDHKKELNRIKDMKKYEEKYMNIDYTCIAGVDEVGRGPLAGPVVAACVILPKDCIILGINDSKKLTEEKRKKLFLEIQEKAIDIGIGIVDETIIDEINILNATLLAMEKAVCSLKSMPQVLLIDGINEIKNLNKKSEKNIIQQTIIEGDAKSISIAAASIIAKVTRDDMMVEFDKKYPNYNFAKNKGYGTKEHIEGIKLNGTTPIHRKSFLRTIL